MSTMSSREEREARSVGEQAAEWLLILEDGHPQDREAFCEWIAKSPLHIEAFLRASTMDTLLSRVDPQRTVPVEKATDLQDVSRIHAAPTAERARSAHKWRTPLRWIAAASVTVAAVFGAWRLTTDLRGDWQRLGTAIGEQRVLELEDGSVLHLNTNSKVTVRFTGEERRVDLLAGEASFRIHRDASRPFRVHSGRVIIEALGTQFNVYRRQEDAVVSVIEGAVQISNPQVNASLRPVRLNAGEEAHVARNGVISPKTPADVSRVNAWRQRRLIFKDEPLAGIAAEFNRYNRTPKIRIEGAGIGERRYAAAFDADDPESLMGILDKDPTLEVEQQADELVIRPRSKPGH